jgi:hypothetical protein
MAVDEYLAAFIKRAAEETGPEYLELYTLLELYFGGREKIGKMLEERPEQSAVILERCKKHLAMLRKIPGAGMAEEERRHYYAAAFDAAYFAAERAGCWHGLKPLVLALRHAEEPLLRSDLRPADNNNIEENIAAHIDRFLHRNWDDEKMKALRRDMACDLADYIKPLKERARPRAGGRDYGHERELDGFDLKYREPNPLWRYAYVRALDDLGVDAGGGGHLIHNILDKAAETDPSSQVKEWAGKTAEALRRVRGGMEEGEHHRRLLRAFWWMRRAHMRTLQSPFDEKEALRTRNTEYR